MGGADNSESGTIGFIGFGEAGSLIAKGLGEAGAPRTILSPTPPTEGAPWRPGLPGREPPFARRSRTWSGVRRSFFPPSYQPSP